MIVEFQDTGRHAAPRASKPKQSKREQPFQVCTSARAERVCMSTSRRMYQHMETDTDTDTDTHRHRHTQTQTQTHRHRHTQTHTQTHTHFLTHTHSHSLTLTHTHSHSLTLTHTHSLSRSCCCFRSAMHHGRGVPSPPWRFSSSRAPRQPLWVPGPTASEVRIKRFD